MRQLSKCYFVVVSIVMASAIFSVTCAQYYMPKASIAISCEDPVDEDGGSGFEDDKEYTPLFTVFTNPLAAPVPGLYYKEIESSHLLEITVPPPEA